MLPYTLARRIGLGACLGVLLGIGGARAQSGGDKVALKKMSYADLVREVRKQTGKVVVVDVWATNCIPCLREFPNLVKLHKELGKKGFVAISVSVDDPAKPGAEDKVRRSLEKYQATFSNVLLDAPPADSFKRFGIGSIPYVVVFNRDNRIALKMPEKADGEVDYKKIRERVLKLLEEK